MHTKNTLPPRRSYREANRKGTEPPGGKRGEEGGEKPIGRLEKRGAERETNLPAYRKGNDVVRKAAASRPAKPNRGATRWIE